MLIQIEFMLELGFWALCNARFVKKLELSLALYRIRHSMVFLFFLIDWLEAPEIPKKKKKEKKSN